MTRTPFLLAAALALASPVRAQAPAEPAPSDVASVDAILTALYDVISGPAGERDWDRFRSLFAPRAVLAPMAPGQDGGATVRVLAVEDYIERSGPFFRQRPFYEVESGRVEERFGNVAAVMSAYESRESPAAEPFSRGVNAITLLHDGERWWVLSIAWDVDRPGNPLPADFGRE